MSLLDEIVARLGAMPETEREALVESAMQATAGLPWVPSTGPQTEAYLSTADVLLYGGAGGGGKSDALLGLAFLALEIKDFADMAAKGGAPTRSGWLSSLWALVGLHGLHITVGFLWASVMMALILRHGENHHTKRLMLMFGLYWHFLDLVWIGIYSVVFLGGLA